MLLSKKAVFFILLVIITVSSVNTGKNIYNRMLQNQITGRATGTASFELLEGPGHFNVSIDIFWLPYYEAPGFKSGQPVGVNVSVKYLDGTPVENATVYMLEQNGWSAFAPTQIWSVAGVTNYQYAIANTSEDGNINFSTTTTGGQSGQQNIIGPYQIKVFVYKEELLLNETSYTSLDRSLPSSDGNTYVPPNQNWVNEVRDKLATISDQMAEWNGGVNKAITIYTDGTDDGIVLNGTAGQPLGLYLTILNKTGSTPINNATIILTEDNGWSALGSTQFWPQNIPYDGGVSNSQTAEAFTDSSGQLNITIVPTAGQSGQQGIIGPYQIYLDVFVDDIQVYSTEIDVTDRTLNLADGTGVPVPNQAWVNEVRDKIFTVADKMGGWT